MTPVELHTPKVPDRCWSLSTGWFTPDRSPVQHRTHTQMEEQLSFSALLAVFWDCGEILEKTHRWNQRQNLEKKLRNVCSKRTPKQWIMHLFAGSHFLYLLYIWNAVDQRVKDAATVFARVFLWAKMGWYKKEKMVWVIQKSLKELGMGALVWSRAMRGWEQDLFTACWLMCVCMCVCVRMCVYLCLWEGGGGRRREAISCHVYVRISTNLQLGGSAALRSSVLPVFHHASFTWLFCTNHMLTPVLPSCLSLVLPPASSLPHLPTLLSLYFSLSLKRKKNPVARIFIFHEKTFSQMTSSLHDFTSRDNNCTFGGTCSFISQLFMLLSISTLLCFPAIAVLYFERLELALSLLLFCYFSWIFFLSFRRIASYLVLYYVLITINIKPLHDLLFMSIHKVEYLGILKRTSASTEPSALLVRRSQR